VIDANGSRAVMVAGCEAAALVLAQRLVLGDTTREGQGWPIDPNDTVLRMAINEQPGASMILAVNDEVADRLLADPGTLSDVFNQALGALGSELGITLSGGPVQRATAARPSVVVEILDVQQLTALAGVTLDVDIAIEDPRAGGATPYVPSQIDGMGAGGRGFGQATPLTVLNDVLMTVTAELGRTSMPVRELLNLSPGMVVEIDRVAGAPIDLLVNGRRIAVGEVVVIDEEFGVRITEIAPPDELVR
jgi:flagellar motor switch protein FliN/FliY